MLYVSGHYPAINEYNVPRNPTINITFNEEIIKSSINYRTISLHDKLYNTIPGDADIDYTNKGTSSGIGNILTFTPSILLNSQQEYSVFVHKKADSVLSVTNSQLFDTYDFSFTTGSGIVSDTTPTTRDQLLIDLQHAIDTENYYEAGRIQDILNGNPGSGEIIYPVVDSGIPIPDIIEELNIISTYPTNSQSNVTLSGDLKFIELTFNDVVNVSGLAMSTYISLTYKDVGE